MRMRLVGAAAALLSVVSVLGAPLRVAAAPDAFQFSTGNPDGKMAMASRFASAGKIAIEAADDFVLTNETNISNASFTGLLPTGDPLSDIQNVGVEIYRVFPADSTTPPSGHVPTRNNSPSDHQFTEADATAGTLTFVATTISSSFAATNSVINGINPVPNQVTGGEGAVTGEEVRFDVTFTPALDLAADHYFFVPQVLLGNGTFLWLSAPHPIVSPGTPFSPDLQTWIRNEDLLPDWLRVGTDIVGGASPPQFNGVFSLTGTTVPASAPGPTTGPSPGSSPNPVAAQFTG